MVAPFTEHGVQEAIRKRVPKKWPGSYLIKTVGGPYQVPGLPDLLGCVGGLFVGLEVKYPKPGESEEHARARATPQQLNQIELINAAGGAAGVVMSVQEALDLIQAGLDRFVQRP